MKNKLIDLNNHLFAQIERLGDEELNKDKLTEEVERAKAVTDVAKRIIENGRLALDAKKAQSEFTGGLKELPDMLETVKTNERG